MARNRIPEPTGWRATDLGICAAAAALPLLCHGAAMFINVEPGSWFTISPAIRWSLAADCMLYTAVCAIVAAPIAGVAVASARRSDERRDRRMADVSTGVGTLSIASVLFTVVSAVFSIAWRFGQANALSLVLQSHVTVLSVTVALAAWGALCAAWLHDPLDAAAVSVIVALGAAGGLLVGGAAVADLPPAVLAVGLTANPLVAVASAAHIDIMRMDLLYQISPLAHMQFEYPTWERACAWYLAVAFACCLGVTWKSRTSFGAFALRGLP